MIPRPEEPVGRFVGISVRWVSAGSRTQKCGMVHSVVYPDWGLVSHIRLDSGHTRRGLKRQKRPRSTHLIQAASGRGWSMHVPCRISRCECTTQETAAGRPAAKDSPEASSYGQCRRVRAGFGTLARSKRGPWHLKGFLQVVKFCRREQQGQLLLAQDSLRTSNQTLR